MSFATKTRLPVRDVYEPRHPIGYWLPLSTRQHELGEAPCGQCAATRHKRCAAGDCTCDCPTKHGANRKRKYVLGDTPCRVCRHNGMHQRCRAGLCSCDCRQRKQEARNNARPVKSPLFTGEDDKKKISFMVPERKFRRD